MVLLGNTQNKVELWDPETKYSIGPERFAQGPESSLVSRRWCCPRSWKSSTVIQIELQVVQSRV